MSSNDWNDQYSEGVWDFLKDSREVAHYAVQAAFVHHFSPSALILDVACGEGILQGYLKPWGYRGYLGIDTSQAAIEKANSRKDDRTSFMTADAEQFTPPHEFTSIVFSECLYYFADPWRIVRHYANWLTGDGTIVLSVYASHDSEGLAIPTDSWTLLEETTVLNARGAWKCTALARKA